MAFFYTPCSYKNLDGFQMISGGFRNEPLVNQNRLNM